MTPLNEDADDASSVGTDGSNGSTGKPVIFFGDHHVKSANQPALKANPSDPEKFRGMEDKLVLSVGAPVLVTDNSRIESGLMNGAIGTLKGSLSSEGCHYVIVDFDHEGSEGDNFSSKSIVLGGADKAL